MNPKPKKTKRSGAPAKGFQWKESTSNRIPNPAIVPVSSKKPKLKPMRAVFGGTNAAGRAFKKINNRMRAK